MKWRMWLTTLNLVALYFVFTSPCGLFSLKRDFVYPVQQVTLPNLPCPELAQKSQVTKQPVATVEQSTPQPPDTSEISSFPKVPETSVEMAPAPTVSPTAAAPPMATTFAPPQALVGDHSQVCSLVVEPCHVGGTFAAQTFGDIYARNSWGSRQQELGTHTRSGIGSDMKGAFDWITGLTKFFNQYPELQTIADIPSGDMGWQMAVRHLNTAKLYFGGDIAKSVAEDNARRYKSHGNKILQHWDLHSCGAPKWHTTCDLTPNNFDVIMIRDALQHISIDKVQEILRKVILESGAKWFITSSYPGSDTLKSDSSACTTDENLFCSKGAMPRGDGGWYPVALDCAPFRFPAPNSKTKSHSTFPVENDFMYIYKIDDALKEAVRTMKPCPVLGGLGSVQRRPTLNPQAVPQSVQAKYPPRQTKYQAIQQPGQVQSLHKPGYSLPHPQFAASSFHSGLNR